DYGPRVLVVLVLRQLCRTGYPQAGPQNHAAQDSSQIADASELREHDDRRPTTRFPSDCSRSVMTRAHESARGRPYPPFGFPKLGTRASCVACGRTAAQSIVISSWPYSTGAPSAATIRLTLPSRDAATGLLMPIASTVAKTCPTRTGAPSVM